MLNKTTLRNAANTFHTSNYNYLTFARYLDVNCNAGIPRNEDDNINAAYARYMNSPNRDAVIAGFVITGIAFVGGAACVIALGIIVPNIALATFTLLVGAATVGFAGSLITYCASSAIRFNTLYNAINDAINANNAALELNNNALTAMETIATQRPLVPTYPGDQQAAAANAAQWVF